MEFNPVASGDIDAINDEWLITEEDVVDMLKHSKKPNSRVKGDIYSDVISQNAGPLSVPLCNIYNGIISSRTWPNCWKNETVVVLPKQKEP